MTAPAALRLVPPVPEHPAKSCTVPGCDDPARLYPEGLRCERHAPGPAITIVRPLAAVPGAA